MVRCIQDFQPKAVCAAFRFFVHCVVLNRNDLHGHLRLQYKTYGKTILLCPIPLRCGDGGGGGWRGGGGVKISLRDRLKHGVEINVMEWQR